MQQMLAYESQDARATILIWDASLTATTFIQSMVVPLMLAAGYHFDTIRDAMTQYLDATSTGESYGGSE